MQHKKPVVGTPRAPFPGLLVKRTAGSGLGLFTIHPIKKGTFVSEYFGSIVSNKEADQRRGRYLFEINSRWSVDGHMRKNTARYMNHSCRPNCEIVIRGHRIFLYTRRAVRADEELTYDYGKEYFDEFIKPHYGCRCERCR